MDLLKSHLSNLTIIPGTKGYGFTQLIAPGIEFHQSLLDGCDLPKHLYKVDLSKNSLTDASFLHSLTFLRELNLSSNSIESLHLQPFKHLHTVDASNNLISHFDSQHDALEELNLRSNKLVKFSLSAATLKTIDLAQNLLESVDLSNCSSLVRADLSQNPTLSSVSLPSALEFLDLSGCTSLTEFENLKSLSNLQVLKLDGVPIEDVQSIAFLKEFSKLREISLVDSGPSDRIELAILIPSLHVIDGEKITKEERQEIREKLSEAVEEEEEDAE
ncbi:hypothetical protein GEMRC1_004511 [Eukaryota sp. GEM-RC1]